jgi:uncharacterized membrane protein YgdD (TMEM256/DUF423 family)
MAIGTLLFSGSLYLRAAGIYLCPAISPWQAAAHGFVVVAGLCPARKRLP